jgi:hypothetical protein
VVSKTETKELLQGDSNTKYFQLVASGKHRKSRIYKLRDENHVIQGDVALKKHITSYYKSLFGPPDVIDVALDETQIQDIPQVSEVESEFLVVPLTVEEIRRALFHMEHYKALGMDGFPIDFLKMFWSTIKDDLVVLS